MWVPPQPVPLPTRGADAGLTSETSGTRKQPSVEDVPKTALTSNTGSLLEVLESGSIGLNEYVTKLDVIFTN